MSQSKKVVLIQPASAGGNFEYIAIPRQGMLFLSGALGQWDGQYQYERQIWFEDRVGLIDPDKDLDGVDILLVTALINEAPRAYQLAALAKEYHPDLITIGGGPQMSPLPEEAIRLGKFDVIVNREGEDIIGQLCDVLIEYQSSPMLDSYLENISGISYMRDGNVTQTKRVGLVAPDFVELPDYLSIKDLSPDNPMAGGVLETVRGCTENCSYCQVIQQFLGYRLINRDTELKRLHQLEQLASDGLIHSGRNGKFNVFISDDLHPPPLRAVKFRNERLERLKNWHGHTDNMNLICQARAEIGQDPDLAQSMYDANIKMLYLGVESNNAQNLLAVGKRQEPGQMERDLTTLNGMGFSVVAMTIIGLPYDTEESIMNLADWVTQNSRYQTANLLTPLPATSNWTDLKPLNENGELLEEGEIRPYHLYTGRQFVHHDERWSMDESREIFDKYTARLTSIDTLYGRIFRILRSYRMRLAASGKDLGDTISSRIAEATETLKLWSDPMSTVGKELGYSVSSRIADLTETLRSVSQPLANSPKELSDTIGIQVHELAEHLSSLADPATIDRQDIAGKVTSSISSLSDLLNQVYDTSTKPNPAS
ncbi:MAG: B12-binding domain-containing radical SAM protein [Dehalococcoidia bacterium]|nr:B12-binding domain-containing radical SAM protein [Dehalococcoidia bacterium]